MPEKGIDFIDVTKVRTVMNESSPLAGTTAERSSAKASSARTGGAGLSRVLNPGLGRVRLRGTGPQPWRRYVELRVMWSYCRDS